MKWKGVVQLWNTDRDSESIPYIYFFAPTWNFMNFHSFLFNMCKKKYLNTAPVVISCSFHTLQSDKSTHRLLLMQQMWIKIWLQLCIWIFFLYRTQNKMQIFLQKTDKVERGQFIQPLVKKSFQVGNAPWNKSLPFFCLYWWEKSIACGSWFISAKSPLNRIIED